MTAETPMRVARTIRIPNKAYLLDRYSSTPQYLFSGGKLPAVSFKRIGILFLESLGEEPITPRRYMERWAASPALWSAEFRQANGLQWEATADFSVRAYDTFLQHDSAFPLFNHLLSLVSPDQDYNSRKWRAEVLDEWVEMQERTNGFTKSHIIV